MPKTCLICEADASAKGGAYCPGCAHLFRWFRSYFAHEPEPVLEWITPELRFIDFGADSLDYMNWLLEAEEKLGVAIPDEEAERIQTVGQFLRYLRARGATWPPDRDLVLLREGGCFQNYAWVEVHRGKVGSSFPLRSDPVSGVRDRDLDG
jgi:acyl carrier protein